MSLDLLPHHGSEMKIESFASMKLDDLYPLVPDILIPLHMCPKMCARQNQREGPTHVTWQSVSYGAWAKGPQPHLSLCVSAQTRLSSQFQSSHWPYFSCDTRHNLRAGKNRNHLVTVLPGATWEIIPLGHCQGFGATFSPREYYFPFLYWITGFIILGLMSWNFCLPWIKPCG